MTIKPRRAVSAFLLLVFAVALFIAVTTSCESRSEADAIDGAKTVATAQTVSDAPLEAYRTDLLDVAFRSVSKMPLRPHLKNRSRAQAAVVDACFQLDQPRRALQYIEAIENWRRGAGYADFAYYCADHGKLADVDHYIDLARREAMESAKEQSSQEWRIDQIRSKIARTYLLLGRLDKADRYAEGLEDSESGRVAITRAQTMARGTVDERLKDIDSVLAAGSLDQVHNALAMCAQLFDRFYDEKDLRSRMESRVRTAYQKLPSEMRTEMMLQLAESALGHGDAFKALELIKDTKAIVDGVRWAPEDRIPRLAQLASLRWRAGDAKGGRKDADDALGLFDSTREKIVDIFRGGALRPLAEAYHAMGERVIALGIYRRAIEEGVHNPNSRPRADDLSAACLSMALHRFEPDAALWSQIEEVSGALSDPW